MKYLVTGGSGYIGSVTTELLCDGGHEVTVFDNLERGHIEAVDPRARLVVGDLRERGPIADLMKALKPDAVLHFAAYALVGESMENPMMYFRNNVGGASTSWKPCLTQGSSGSCFRRRARRTGSRRRCRWTRRCRRSPRIPTGRAS